MHKTREHAGAGVDLAQADLLVEAIGDVGNRARRYLQEPADPAWRDLVHALSRACGDSEAYDLLRAVEIHVRTRSGLR